MEFYLLKIHPDENKQVPLLAIEVAAKHIQGILTLAVKHTSKHQAIVIYDTLCPLSIALKKAYQYCLPSAVFIDFYSVTPAFVHDTFTKLQPADLVILIQSNSFRLDAFRIRVELFKRSLKVIEHPHLEHMQGIQAIYYIDSLQYDSNYLHSIGHKLKRKIDQANSTVIDSGNNDQLIFDTPLESAKLNIGDYSNMNNIGGQFPIGEVFTEAKDLEAVNGCVRIFAFGDKNFLVNKAEKPITLVVKKGRVTEAINSTDEFDKVLADIRADEQEVWLRELGFGLNKAFTFDRIVNDIGTYERMCGIHLSLGAKHGLYKKPIFSKTKIRHHVDVFVATEAVLLDGNVVFSNQHGYSQI